MGEATAIWDQKIAGLVRSAMFLPVEPNQIVFDLGVQPMLDVLEGMKVAGWVIDDACEVVRCNSTAATEAGFIEMAGLHVSQPFFDTIAILPQLWHTVGECLHRRCVH